MDLTIQVIEELKALQGTVMIIFRDVAMPPETKATGRTRPAPAHIARVAELEQKLQQAYEEMQTSQEERKSINEELQSSNEELRSSNEELTTSREEM